MKDQELTAAIEQVIRTDLEAIIRTTWIVRSIEDMTREALSPELEALSQVLWCRMIVQELQNMMKANGITDEEHNKMARSILREKQMLATLREE